MKFVQIELPEELAEQAEQAGLLEPEKMEQLIRAQLRRDAWAFLEEAKRRMEACDDTPPMSLEEISEEVRAVRRERRER